MSVMCNKAKNKRKIKMTQMLKHSLFLDDERNPIHVDWIRYPTNSRFHPKNLDQEYEQTHIARTFKEFVDYIRNNVKTSEDLENLEVSFDHDLGDYYYYSTFTSLLTIIDLFDQLGAVFPVENSNACDSNHQTKVSFQQLVQLKNQHLEFATMDAFADYLKQNKDVILHHVQQYCEMDDFYKGDPAYCAGFSEDIVSFAEDKATQSELIENIERIELQKGFKFNPQNRFGDFLDFAILCQHYKKDNELTGASCLEFLCDYVLDNIEQFKGVNDQLLLEHFHFHSMNTVRRQYIRNYWVNFVQRLG